MSGRASNHWKAFALLFPIVGMAAATALAQGPGSQRAFFQAWWGVVANIPADPAEIDGLEWWIDASDLSSISLQAGTDFVAQWNDKSGNNKHLTQPTSADRPELIYSEQNGNAVVRFDGSTDSMSVPSSDDLFLFLHESNTTWFAVARFGTNQYPGVNMHLFDNTGFAAGIGMSFAYRSSVSTFTNAFQIRVNRGLTSYVISQQPTNSGKGGEYVSIAHIANLTASASDRSRMYINSDLYQDNNETGAINFGDAWSDLAIGRNSSSTSSMLLGDICEIIIYNGILSAADFNAVRDYLNNKWGITY